MMIAKVTGSMFPPGRNGDYSLPTLTACQEHRFISDLTVSLPKKLKLSQAETSPAVLTATSQSNGKGQTSTLTESKPVNRLR